MSKFIKYTLVDSATKLPVSQEPSKMGPTHPDGVVPTFGVESTYSTGVPTFYGVSIEDNYVPEAWMTQVEEAEFYQALKAEFKIRAKKQRQAVEANGFVLADGQTKVRTDIESQNRVANLVTSLNLNQDTTAIDFEVQPGQWILINRDEAFDIATKMADHVQSCFTWGKNMDSQIDAVSTLDQALAAITAIVEYK